MAYQYLPLIVVILTIFLTDSFILYMVTRFLKFKKQDLKTAFKTISVCMVGMLVLIQLIYFISFRFWFGLSELLAGNFFAFNLFLLILFLVFLLYLIRRFYSVGWNEAFSAVSIWFTIVFVLTTLFVVLLGLPLMTLANFVYDPSVRGDSF